MCHVCYINTGRAKSFAGELSRENISRLCADRQLSAENAKD